MKPTTMIQPTGDSVATAPEETLHSANTASKENIENVEASFFQRITDPSSPKTRSVMELLQEIREGTYRSEIEAIRNASTKEQRDDLKKKLPLSCWSGTFTSRKATDLVRHSGLICFDFDGIPEEHLAFEREKLESMPFALAVFRSPSGNGLKALARVEPNADQHGENFQAIAKHIVSQYLDASGKDVSRACYMSWDPELYCNPEAEVFCPLPAKVLPEIPEGELQEVLEEAMARAFSSAQQQTDILDEILKLVEPVNFRELAHLEDDSRNLTRKHYVVHAVEQILKQAKKNNWGLCMNDGAVHVFNGSFWKPLIVDDLKRLLGRAAEKMGVDMSDARHFRFRQELMEQFLSEGYRATPPPAPETTLVNLCNGTLAITPAGRELRPFNPEDFLTYQLPFDLDSAAEAPTFQAYLDKILPDPDCQKILSEFMGYLFIKPSVLKLEKVLLLYGTGANGKSVFFDIMVALLGGSANVSNASLESITKDRDYTRAMLANKLVNYASEISTKLDPSTFKTLSSGEPIPARMIYGPPFTMTNYAKLVFNCNELPKETEQNHGFYRRFLILPFDVTIPDKEQDKELAQKIIGTELSGVFNWVLDGLDRLLQNKRFTESTSVQQKVEDYRRQSDSLLCFLDDEHWNASSDVHQPLQDFYQSYRSYCHCHGNTPCGYKTFGERLRRNGFKLEKKNYGVVAYLKQDRFPTRE